MRVAAVVALALVLAGCGAPATPTGTETLSPAPPPTVATPTSAQSMAAAPDPNVSRERVSGMRLSVYEIPPERVGAERRVVNYSELGRTKQRFFRRALDSSPVTSRTTAFDPFSVRIVRYEGSYYVVHASYWDAVVTPTAGESGREAG